uniref:Outer-membrane lipoprotein LolB n=1 Tax=Candidatus Kentrum sp. MB TaxID=2138164 RepID=A0A450XIV3_9GAMM|nr:MAG: outer membrane lipoprotein LolB [Candidatus Kentron sp. MB]VFK74714.1 MAG: outer membrane lipoprotein LolB [Candidatus Kentron sp. MB]
MFTEPPPVPVADPHTEWQARKQKLAGLHQWSATGRVAIRTEKEAWNVGMRWRQQRDNYRIRFHAPLALGTAEIIGTPRGVQLRTNRETLSAPDPEALLRRVMGWHIPLSGLRNWILGRPEAGVPEETVEIDAAGRLMRLRQSGWEIRYLAYRRIGEMVLPTRLTLENARFRARVRISRWRLP